MNHSLRSRLPIFLLVGLFAFKALPALAFSPPNLSNLDSDQVDAVFKDFGTSFVFRPLEPASEYGKITGYMPNAQIYLGMQLPKGFAVEFGFFPSLTIGGFKGHSVGGDVKWTLNDSKMGGRMPFNLAIRAMYTASGLSYGQTVSGVSDTITYSASNYGGNLSISKKILFIEPYVGIGYVGTNNTLSNTGTVTLYQQSVSLTDSFSDSNGGTWFYAGVQVWFLVPAVTVEYDNMYGVGAGSVKVSFKF
jgi:hypothetical protein